MVEHDALSVTREAYDAAAPTYAQLFRDTLRDSPLDRAILGAFAEVVSASGDGQVADLGCGPGHITAYLDELGLAAFGVDASPAMIKLAGQAYPGLRFDVGSMAALNIADGVLGGVLSRWSIIHTPPQELPVILAEFHRVLAPGGHLLVGFSASDDPSHPTQVFDHTVAPAYRWWPDHLAGDAAQVRVGRGGPDGSRASAHRPTAVPGDSTARPQSLGRGCLTEHMTASNLPDGGAVRLQASTHDQGSPPVRAPIQSNEGTQPTSLMAVRALLVVTTSMATRRGVASQPSNARVMTIA